MEGIEWWHYLDTVIRQYGSWNNRALIVFGIAIGIEHEELSAELGQAYGKGRQGNGHGP